MAATFAKEQRGINQREESKKRNGRANMDKNPPMICPLSMASGGGRKICKESCKFCLCEDLHDIAGALNLKCKGGDFTFVELFADAVGDLRRLSTKP